MSQIVKLRCHGCGCEFIGFHDMRCLVCGCRGVPVKSSEEHEAS